MTLSVHKYYTDRHDISNQGSKGLSDFLKDRGMFECVINFEFRSTLKCSPENPQHMNDPIANKFWNSFYHFFVT